MVNKKPIEAKVTKGTAENQAEGKEVVTKKSRKNGKGNNSLDSAAPNNSASDNNPMTEPKAPVITPDIEYREKSAAPIDTNERSIDLSRAVKDPSNYAGRDNSMDGFLSIRH